MLNILIGFVGLVFILFLFIVIGYITSRIEHFSFKFKWENMGLFLLNGFMYTVVLSLIIGICYMLGVAITGIIR